MNAPHDPVLLARLDSLHRDVVEVKEAMGQLTDAITRLALAEERQLQMSQALERAFKTIGEQEMRLRAIELAQPIQKQTSEWVGKGMWLAAGAAATYVGKKTGLW